MAEVGRELRERERVCREERPTVAAARQTLARSLDPELRFEVGLKLHGLTYQRGKATDLGAVADELDARITGAD